MSKAGLDWPGLLRAGLGGLRLLPRDFWALTPAELAMMLGDPAATRPLGRSALEALRRQWPDEIAEDGNDRSARSFGE